MKRLLLLMMMGVLGLTHSSPARAAVSEGKYMAGGIVGTVVGFGIGHAVVGEYKKI